MLDEEVALDEVDDADDDGVAIAVDEVIDLYDNIAVVVEAIVFLAQAVNRKLEECRIGDNR